MNFRNFVSLSMVSIIAMMLTSCSGNDGPDEPKHLKLSESTLTFSSAGGKYDVEITSNTQWSITEIPTWISVSPKSGSGNAKIIIESTANPDYSSRSVDIKFEGVNGAEKLYASVHIQQGLNETIIVDGASATIGWIGGALEIPYKFTSKPSITIDGNPEWIKITNGSRALSDNKVIVEVAKNDGDERKATIQFQLEDKTEDFIVTQEAYIPVQSVCINQSSPLMLTANGTSPLVADIYPSNCSDKSLVWSSSNPEIVSVSDDGLLTVVSNGEVFIKVTAADGVSAEIKVIVKIKAESIAFVEWYDGNGWIQPGWQQVTEINGSWGYEYIPQIQVVPQNAFIGDLNLISSNNMLVWVDGDKFVCSKNQTGIVKITAESEYSNVSVDAMMEVRPCYILAGLGHIEQTTSHFNMKLAGVLYTKNTSDKFDIVSITILDENNQVVTTGFSANNGTNNVRWRTSDYINLSDYGIYVIEGNSFNEKLSKWKAKITYSNVNYQGTYTEIVNIDSRTQY